MQEDRRLYNRYNRQHSMQEDGHCKQLAPVLVFKNIHVSWCELPLQLKRCKTKKCKLRFLKILAGTLAARGILI